MKCPICHGPLKGEAYCPNCGQAITYEGIKQTYSDITLVPSEVKNGTGVLLLLISSGELEIRLIYHFFA